MAGTEVIFLKCEIWLLEKSEATPAEVNGVPFPEVNGSSNFANGPLEKSRRGGTDGAGALGVVGPASEGWRGPVPEPSVRSPVAVCVRGSVGWRQDQTPGCWEPLLGGEMDMGQFVPVRAGAWDKGNSITPV